MAERVRRKSEPQNVPVEDEGQKTPTAKWRLDYHEKPGHPPYFVVKDEEDKVLKTIRGRDARLLKQILTAQNPHVPQDVVDAYRPLVLEVFKDEVGLYEEDQAYKDDLIAKQPRQHNRETPEEVYRRYWTGHLMPFEIAAEDVADRIIKSEDRVRVAVAWGNVDQDFIKEKTEALTAMIKEFHPRGPQGK